MPQNVRIWEISTENTLVEVARSDISQEVRLEEWLVDDISALDEGLLVIGRQVRTDFGGEIDLLCLDSQGDTVTVELKKGKTPRDVTAQTLDYASWASKLSYEQISEIAGRYLKSRGSLKEVFKQKFEMDLPDALNEEPRSLIVAEAMDESTERIVRYLAECGVRINVATVHHFRTKDGKEMLAQVFLIEPELAESIASNRSKRRPYVTAAEMQAMADSSGVGKLYRHLSEAASSLLSDNSLRISSFGSSSRGFQIHSEGRTLSIFVVDLDRSNKTSGLRFRLNAIRVMNVFGLSEEQVRACLPGDSESMPDSDWRLALPEETANWVGFCGYFRTTGDIDDFLRAVGKK